MNKYLLFPLLFIVNLTVGQNMKDTSKLNHFIRMISKSSWAVTQNNNILPNGYIEIIEFCKIPHETSGVRVYQRSFFMKKDGGLSTGYDLETFFYIYLESDYLYIHYSTDDYLGRIIVISDDEFEVRMFFEGKKSNISFKRVNYTGLISDE
jgi:hypothetical protein